MSGACDCGRGGMPDLWHKTDCPHWRSMHAMVAERKELAEALRLLRGWIANDDAVNAEIHDSTVDAGVAATHQAGVNYLIKLASAALAKAGL